MHSKYKDLIKNFVLIIMVPVFLEMILSNYNMISCLSGPHDLSADHVEFYIDGNGTQVCEIKQIEFAVKNIVIVYNENTKEPVRYTVSVDLYGQEGWETVYPEKWEIVDGSTRICTNCATIAHSIKITGDFVQGNIKSIILNNTELRFNLFRYILLMLLSVCVYYGRKNLDLNFTMRWKPVLLMATSVSLLIIIFAAAEMGSYLRTSEETENQDMNLVVEALEAHQVSFLAAPPEELIDMDNPYDYSLRANMGISYIFDIAYYEGKYYTYFGIAPVLLLMLPFHLLTGRYLHTYMANLIFIVIFVYLSAILYHMLMKRYVHSISKVLYLVGYLTLIIGSGALSLLRGEKYDITVTCALDCVILSVILLYHLLESSRWNEVKIFLAGGVTGLIVLSKPNFIVYYIAVGALFYKYLQRYFGWRKFKKAIWFAASLSICAIFQMSYNYLRFDNILEFGIQYLLGANMQLFSWMSMAKIFKSAVAYLFAAPAVNVGQFPFVTLTYGVTGMGINTYPVPDKCMGLVFIPVLYVLFFKKDILRRTSVRKNVKEISLAVNIMILIAILNLTISSATVSVCDEYLIDVRMSLILAGIVLYSSYISGGCERIHSKIFIALCIMTILVMLPVSLNFRVSGSGQVLELFNRPNIYLKNVFEFWT